MCKNNADLNHVEDNGDTALHIATKRGNIEIVKMLLDHGAKIDLKNVNDKTVLDIAKENNRDEICMLLGD